MKIPSRFDRAIPRLAAALLFCAAFAPALAEVTTITDYHLNLVPPEDPPPAYPNADASHACDSQAACHDWARAVCGEWAAVISTYTTSNGVPTSCAATCSWPNGFAVIVSTTHQCG